MSDKKAVLVTGATGFIGSRLCTILEQKCFHVLRHSSRNGDIADPSSLDQFREQPIHHVFHCAAKTFVPRSWEKPLDFITTNVTGTGTVLELCRQRSVSLTYVSAYVYGSDVINPITEDSVPMPNNPYALSKRMAEELCEFYAKFMSVNVNIVRPFNVYGPGQPEEFLIPLIIKQVKEGRQVEVKDLFPRRDYIYIDDVVECIVKAMDRPGFGVYNAGTGKSYSVKDVVDTVLKIAGKDLPVLSQQVQRPNEISDTIASIEAAEKHLGWKPRFDLLKGLSAVYNS
jgi:nucleoside-diphosphate-sugar epimerase